MTLAFLVLTFCFRGRWRDKDVSAPIASWRLRVRRSR